MAVIARRAVEELVKSYHELNLDFVNELKDLPTPLEFMRCMYYCGLLGGESC